jgi:anti-sigma factor RsiW
MMNDMAEAACEEMRLLIQAEIDGELDAARVAVLGAHVAECAGCTAMREQLTGLSTALRRDLTYYAAPASVRATVERRLVADQPAPSRPPPAVPWLAALRQRWREATAFGGGAALAAALVLLLVLPGRSDLANSVVSDHIRALQPGHLMDVMSTDQHTVKPWFDGRLDFAPPVKDLASQGFPLSGGRLDYIDEHPAAALVYHRAKHVINLFVWPDRRHRSTALPASAERNGYNFVHWSQDGMNFWAVSDLEATQLADFVRLWHAAA